MTVQESFFFPYVVSELTERVVDMRGVWSENVYRATSKQPSAEFIMETPYVRFV